MSELQKPKSKFGTLPVFFTAISTILGAVMFLRFGYAVGSVGFLGTLAIVFIGHLVTVPTSMSIAEIATNQKVEGGGEYYIISRSFGINIGAAIGVALYLSQAISVAFYVIAFAEAFDPVLAWLADAHGIYITDKRMISVPAILLLSILMLTKGADLGMKALYGVVFTLFVSLVMFFMGSTDYQMQGESFDMLAHVTTNDDFFMVFAIIFPAFTGMTAGVGLSGDLKDPKKAIPLGTVSATLIGMVIYLFIAYKLATNASPEDLVSDSLVMSKIALWGPIIPIGLAAATISSALGSIMVAPRTLQALAMDKIFPSGGLNAFLSKGKKKNNEPVNSTLVTVGIALFFVAMGDINSVAKVISMFFMVTYGAICTISFFQHFAADPSYRPAFRSKWFISLLGAVMCLFLVFKMDAAYAFFSLAIMVLIYLGLSRFNKEKAGMANIFQGVIFQLIRQIQVFIQKADKDDQTWRPSVICISGDAFERPAAFELMRWISHRYGFGTYLHFIKGYFSKETSEQSRSELERLIRVADISDSNVYVDTMVSPSYTSAIAQCLQLPSVSGKENNMILFEFSKANPVNLGLIMENYSMVRTSGFDTCILASSDRGLEVKTEIHIWITPSDFNNSNLMILLGYVILGHPQWKKAEIKISTIVNKSDMEEEKDELLELIKSGRLPISANNINIIEREEGRSIKESINEYSRDADLTIVGFRSEAVKQRGEELFMGFEDVGDVLFVNSTHSKEIK
ncbi:amino acid permease [Gilvimarinus agarilyticus]|uniref:Amino acid transporter n=1 Tax=Reichenbachiella agariperforans TaxID=156994 RepID=A0A1M6W1W5_REIAG|nr:amino acid permease [Reichenbachiella agariperforans]MBU2885849.1 amino acid permease [Gilvimarinus agarilyticus]MBU2915232.1 amino acid permease [Reichenbachiella agariperforans]SHK87751.1 Amino acid transporter [Reichenbachiella agariperforans]